MRDDLSRRSAGEPEAGPRDDLRCRYGCVEAVTEGEGATATAPTSRGPTVLREGNGDTTTAPHRALQPLLQRSRPSYRRWCPRAGGSSPSGAFLVRGGGAKVAPRTPSRGEGGNSRPVLGPITRRGTNGADSQGQGKGDEREEFAPQFLDFQSRVGFMKKVYLTVSCQLVYTGLVCMLMRGYRDPILRLLFANGSVPQVLFFVGTLGTIIFTNATLWANVDLRQSFPRNLPLLTLFTTAWATYVGVFSLMFTQGSVNRAVFQTAAVVGSLTAYAFRTNPKHELTQFGAGLYSAGNALGMFCLMKLLFFRRESASSLAISCLATLLFSLYLVFDTYRIIGGKHRRSTMFGVKDWAMAAIALYEDIMQIFIHLLALFGETQR
ncbi:unnamed protein product [Ascophyllum nodosum]